MTIDTLGVVGAGAMGSGIIEVAAKSGVSVIARDISPEAVEAGTARVAIAGRHPSRDVIARTADVTAPRM